MGVLSKGVIALLLIAFVIWFFWMSWIWLRKPKINNKPKKPKKMKKNKLLILLPLLISFACETVQPGHKGVEISWGGETNMNQVYPEGMDGGLHWMFDDMVEYDVREKTIVQKFEFNDKNNMITGVELALDYNLDPKKVNLLHTQINDVHTKILKTLKSAGKEVVPKYSAVELNITKRTKAEQELSAILALELPEFYVEFARVQMTDVDIPKKVAALAEQTAVQLGKNELAEKKEAEKIALAKAKIAEAEGNFKAAQYDAKTKDILSQPKMLELLRVENEKLKWQGFLKHGQSPYGNNNIFGANTPVIKGLK